MRRMMVLAHREELIYQAVAHARNAGLTASIEMNRLSSGRDEVVVSSIQTQIARSKCKWCRGRGCDGCKGTGKRMRMTYFNPYDFGLLIIDEAHHATAESYRLVLEYYKQNPYLKILMVTATPKRGDNVGMHNVCDSVAYEMQLKAAIEGGWLCPIRQRFITVDSLDLSRVKTKSDGDLKDGELERVFLGETDAEEEKLLHSIAKPCIEEAKGKPLLVFASGQAHAEKLTAAFNAYDGISAEMVIDKTEREERKRIVERYKQGDTQVLVNVACFTEGFDAPKTAVVAIARPTKSESLYLQMIGRGTRPLAGVVDGPETPEERRQAIAESAKPYCTILDFVGNSGRHKLISVADVLAGDDVEPIDLEAALAEAKEIGEAVDMEELLEKAKQAREEAEKRKQEMEEEMRRRLSTQHRAERAEYTAQDVDLFGGRSFDPFTDYEPAPWGATPKQVNLLIALGVSPETATSYTKGQAGKVITKLKQTQIGGEYRVTFGKHRGKKLSQLPNGYIDWALGEGAGGKEFRENVEIMRGSLEEVPF